MTTYLVHEKLDGTPVGIWNELGQSIYTTENSPMEKSAKSLMGRRFENETWAEFSDRIGNRFSHRDWWKVFESSSDDLQTAWEEAVPSQASVFKGLTSSETGESF